jgi:hypothetical protein
MPSTLWIARAAACATVTALSVVLGFAASALAGQEGTAKYEYKPTSLHYDALGYLDGSRFGATSCNPNVDAIWSGQVETKSTITDPVEGEGSFTIAEKGEKGKIVAGKPGFNYMSASHSIVTECDTQEPPSPSEYQNTDCNPQIEMESDILIVGKITGGVGTKVQVKWRISVDPLSTGNFLLPNSLSCVEPFAFPAADCKPVTTTIDKFTAPKLSLPFGCFGKTSTPPPGSGYTMYGSSDAAHGTVDLKRTKIHTGKLPFKA